MLEDMRRHMDTGSPWPVFMLEEKGLGKRFTSAFDYVSPADLLGDLGYKLVDQVNRDNIYAVL